MNIISLSLLISCCAPSLFGAAAESTCSASSVYPSLASIRTADCSVEGLRDVEMASSSGALTPSSISVHRSLPLPEKGVRITSFLEGEMPESIIVTILDPSEHARIQFCQVQLRQIEDRYNKSRRACLKAFSDFILVNTNLKDARRCGDRASESAYTATIESLLKRFEKHKNICAALLESINAHKREIAILKLALSSESGWYEPRRVNGSRVRGTMAPSNDSCCSVQ